MLITKLKSKIHLATVTGIELNYEGSCAIDKILLKEANISEGEQIHVLNRNNGERFITYAMSSDIPGEVSVRGPGAHKAKIGDVVVIVAYAQVEPLEILNPSVVFVNPENKKMEPGYVHDPAQFYRNR